LGGEVHHGSRALLDRSFDDGAISQVPQDRGDVVVTIWVAPKGLCGTTVHGQYVGARSAQRSDDVAPDEPRAARYDYTLACEVLRGLLSRRSVL
jgi:hypothetical protein